MAETLLKKIQRAGKWIVLIGIIPPIALVSYFTWENHKKLEVDIISMEERNLLLITESLSTSLEEYFKERLKNVKTQANDTLMQKGLFVGDITPELKEEVHETFEAYHDSINAIYLLNKKGEILYREPESHTVKIGKSYAHKQGVSFVLKHHKPYISEIFHTDSGKFAISVLSPVNYKDNFAGIVRWLIKMDTLSKKYIESINEQKNCFVQILHEKGKVLNYPYPEYIGEDLLTVKKKRFPNHDWSGLDALIKKMTYGEGVSAIYQDYIGDGNNFENRVLSLSLAKIGDQFWSIGISHDYSEIEERLDENAWDSLVFLGVLFLIFGAGGYGLYRTQEQKAISETEKEMQRQATKQWQNTFNAIKDMIVIVDKDRKIVKTNQAVLQYIPDIRSGSICYEMFHGVERLPKGCMSCKVFETGEPTSSEYFDPRLKVWFNLQAFPIKNSNKQVEHLVHIFRDITLQKKELGEKGKLELQLQRSEKMEAIGTLAGGVAHDLNNVLGGVVSYPELILMQIPEEDVKLKKQILIIQKSGQKAAAIVQDLLTLARRGVVTNDVVNLNDVINDYLQSPEFDSLKTYNPNVKIETDLKRDLLNILGSSVHLSKTIMNLITNAAEAINDNGIITISSNHQYIDKPIRGYDEIEEGNYAVIKVADDGIGIPAEHINKIFEPFYTKKKMGRSGTGLGMAVVWGTVKDHKGYIDIQSNVGEGTTFSLYFPVTRKEIMEKMGTGAIEDYIGNGESILVVDDVEEQRQIASGMLKELGYSVLSVSSGEEAIEYLKSNKVDLLVLDMIMDPGMDGLDSYKKILEIHPGQKAIIASGFSETDRVKEVQGLGAGAYIRKPFLLEKIGLAVKKELEK